MRQTMSSVRQPKKFDFILLTIIVLLALSSFIAIYSSFPLMKSYMSTTGTLLKQIQFYIIGFVALLGIMYVGNDTVYNFAKLAYKIVLGALAYLFISSLLYRFIHINLPFVNRVNGATSWFIFPVIGTIQPSEFMKIILIIISAQIIKEHNEDKYVDSFMDDISLFIKILKWCFPPMLLILLQPDTGICLIIAFSIALMLACGGIRKEWVIGVALLVVLAIALMIGLFYFNQTLFTKIFGGSYRTARIYGWLQPEQYANTHGLQLYTALMSIGSSGLTGHGIQADIISIPEPHTDFIFAVIGLNFGFIGCMFVVGLCAALDFRLFQIASRTNDPIEKFMIIGFLGMLLFQQVENIGMTLGLLPITGVTLPLISAGGSSLISYLIAFGIVFNASMKAKKLSDYVYD